MNERKLLLYFYRNNADFTLPPEFPSLPLIPLLKNTSEDYSCLDGMYETTVDPEIADYIVFPYDLSSVLGRFRTLFLHFYIRNLPLYSRYESKHVFFASHDRGQPLCTDAVIFTHAPRKSNSDDRNLITFPYFPLNHVLASSPELSFENIRYDICFIGTQSDPTRVRAINSFQKEKGIRYFFRTPNTTDWSDKNTSYLHMSDKAKKRELEDMYLNNMKKSWAILCPRGMGSSSFRFYETMCMGRIPVHISDEYVFPFADEIDYSRFCINIPEAAVDVAGNVLAKWFQNKSSEELETICRTARSTWEKYFHNEKSKEIMLKLLASHRAKSGRASHSYLEIENEYGEGKRIGYERDFSKISKLTTRKHGSTGP